MLFCKTQKCEFAISKDAFATKSHTYFINTLQEDIIWEWSFNKTYTQCTQLLSSGKIKSRWENIYKSRSL